MLSRAIRGIQLYRGGVRPVVLVALRHRTAAASAAAAQRAHQPPPPPPPPPHRALDDASKVTRGWPVAPLVPSVYDFVQPSMFGAGRGGIFFEPPSNSPSTASAAASAPTAATTAVAAPAPSVEDIWARLELFEQSLAPLLGIMMPPSSAAAVNNAPRTSLQASTKTRTSFVHAFDRSLEPATTMTTNTTTTTTNTTTTTTTMDKSRTLSIGEELSSDMFLASETEFVSSHAYEVSESLQTKLLYQYQQALRGMRHEHDLGVISMVFFEGIQGLRRIAIMHPESVRQSNLRKMWLFRSAVNAYRECNRLDLAKQLFHECASGELRDIASDLSLEMMNIFLKQRDLRTVMWLFGSAPPTLASCELAILGCLSLRSRTLTRDLEHVMDTVARHELRLNPHILQYLVQFLTLRESNAHEAVVCRIIENVLAHHAKPFTSLAESTAFAKTLAAADFYQAALSYLRHTETVESGLSPATPIELVTQLVSLSEVLTLQSSSGGDSESKHRITDVGVAIYREQYWLQLFSMLERLYGDTSNLTTLSALRSHRYYNSSSSSSSNSGVTMPRALLLEFLWATPLTRESMNNSLRFMCAHDIESPALWSHMLEIITMIDLTRTSRLVRMHSSAAAAMSPAVARRVAMHHVLTHEVHELVEVLELVRTHDITIKPLAHLMATNVLANSKHIWSTMVVAAAHSVHELVRQQFHMPLGLLHRLLEKPGIERLARQSPEARAAMRKLKLLCTQLTSERRASHQTPLEPLPPPSLARSDRVESS